MRVSTLSKSETDSPVRIVLSLYHTREKFPEAHFRGKVFAADVSTPHETFEK